MTEDRLADLVEKWSTIVARATETYGPEAARIIDRAARINAFQNSVVPLLLGAICLGAAAWIRPRWVATWDGYDSGPPLCWGIGFFGFAFFGIVLCICSVEPAAWIGMFDPGVWVVTKLMQK